MGWEKENVGGGGGLHEGESKELQWCNASKKIEEQGVQTNKGECQGMGKETKR